MFSILPLPLQYLADIGVIGVTVQSKYVKNFKDFMIKKIENQGQKIIRINFLYLKKIDNISKI